VHWRLREGRSSLHTPPSWGDSRALLRQIRTRIDGAATHDDLVVQVRARRTARVAADCDRLTALHLLTHGDRHALEMPEPRSDVVAVVEVDGVAVLGRVADERDASVRGRDHARPWSRRQIDAVVKFLGPGPRRET